jgi:uncharacterized membrane protein YccC
MKLIRRIILFVCGAFALIDLGGVLLHLVTFHWVKALWALLYAAGWGAVCVYMIRLERNSTASSSGQP